MPDLTPEQTAAFAADAEMKRYEYFRTLGLDEKHAGLLSASSAKELIWNGVRLIYKATGKPAVEDSTAADFYKAEYPLLFPTKPDVDVRDNGQFAPKVPADIVAAALAGSVTARGAVFTALGLKDRDPTALTQLDAFLTQQKIAAAPAAPSGDDARDLAAAKGSNPWHPDTFNLFRQMQIAKSDPALAARLSKKFGGLGVTKKQAAENLRRAS